MDGSASPACRPASTSSKSLLGRATKSLHRCRLRRAARTSPTSSSRRVQERRSPDRLFSKARLQLRHHSVSMRRLPIRAAPCPRASTTTRRVSSTKRADSRFEACRGRAVFNVFPAMPGAGMPGWFLKSVTIDGENVTDIPFDVSTAGDDTRIEIVMTDKQTTLSGTVKNPRGEQTTDYTVVIFPDRLKEGAMPGRYTRTVRPDQQGRFRNTRPSARRLFRRRRRVAGARRPLGSRIPQTDRAGGETIQAQRGSGGDDRAGADAVRHMKFRRRLFVAGARPIVASAPAPPREHDGACDDRRRAHHRTRRRRGYGQPARTCAGAD